MRLPITLTCGGMAVGVTVVVDVTVVGCSGDSETEETVLNNRLAVDRVLAEAEEGVTGAEVPESFAEEEMRKSSL